MVEIARSVHANARIIIFDEPTASLTPEEKKSLLFAGAAARQQRGVTIVFISHALEEALEISDRITVLRDGEHVATDRRPRLDRDKIIRAMVGRTLSHEVYGEGRTERRAPGASGR